MSEFLRFAPVIIVVVGFLIAYKIFVTPAQLEKELTRFRYELDKKYVHKEVHALAISQMKEDISEIKKKIDIMYDILIKVREK